MLSSSAPKAELTKNIYGNFRDNSVLELLDVEDPIDDKD